MKILALSSIRSDYDLLSPLYKLLHNDKNIQLKLLVSGAHLSKDFGYTKQYIQEDAYEILLEVETLINADSLSSRIKTASILLQNSIDIVNQYSPDLILFAGDREDVMVGALLGTYLNIPTIHFYGGDHEFDGHQDTYIRHSCSKLSSLHFVAAEEHQERLLKMGENPKSIFNIGSISLDKFKNFPKSNLSNFFKINIPKKFALVIYHPLQNEDPEETFSNILKSLEKNNIFSIVSYPNTDPGYLKINEVINTYKNNNNFLFYKNLPREIFLSVFANSSFMIGNSSAGIYEAASLKIPVINVGLRQKGRLCSKNVIFTSNSQKEIEMGLNHIEKEDYKKTLTTLKNVYGNGKSAKKAYKLIKKLNLQDYIPKIYDPLKDKYE